MIAEKMFVGKLYGLGFINNFKSEILPISFSN